MTPRAIAIKLNAEGVVSPETKLWNDTTIRGHLKRGTGIINNELYLGRLVWNRLHYVKDPVTGKRISRLNPESQWIFTKVHCGRRALASSEGEEGDCRQIQCD